MTRRKATTSPTLRLEAGDAVRFLIAKQTHVTEDRPRRRDVPVGTEGLVERSEVNGTVLLVVVAVAPDGATDAVIAGSSEVEVIGHVITDPVTVRMATEMRGDIPETHPRRGARWRDITPEENAWHEYCKECGVCQNDHGDTLRQMHIESRHKED